MKWLTQFDVEIDGRVLGFSVGLAVVTSLLFSIPSVLRVARANFGDALRDATRGATDTHERLRGTLVVAQIAVGLMLSSGLLMGSFAGMALLLTAAGLYGVLAYSVLRRTREIGVRIALGASSRIVAGMVLRRAMVLVLIGVPLGIALAGDTLLLRMLTEARPGSAPLLVLASAVVILTAGVAAYVPARRAASIDPTLALRTE